MHLLRTLPLILLLLICISSAGCISLLDGEDAAANSAPGEPGGSGNHTVISQPDSRSDYVRMDTDIFNTGEVIEFQVTNNGLIPLECSRTPPDFRVLFQTGSGRWAVKMGTEHAPKGNVSYLAKGDSTPVYRFISTGWEAGRYRIVSDCGVAREILIRAVPVITPEPTSTPCPATNDTRTTPWITIGTVGDQHDGVPFTVGGTTNLPAGRELSYSIFSVASREEGIRPGSDATFLTAVEEGSCGVNTWTAMGEIQATGEFFIGITDAQGTASAIQRFSVYP